ncbi:unnamed protein product [Oikopleura dioica]|uniref:Uncharacterized protein n=1 Tax=Oikopleura dioica TaxID=34765 RepID=E4XC20_OIKDI|nr:unnamed protein product [Oikopleura dioica]
MPPSESSFETSEQQIETVSSASIKFKSCNFAYSLGVFLFIPCSIALDFVPAAAENSYIFVVLSSSLLLLKVCHLCRLHSGVGKFMESVVIFSSIFVFGIVLLTAALFVAIYFERSELGSISCFVIIAAFVGIVSSAALKTSSLSSKIRIAPLENYLPSLCKTSQRIFTLIIAYYD